MKSTDWKWWHKVQSCQGQGSKIELKSQKPESTLFTSQSIIHIHGGLRQREQITSNLQKEKTEAENGNLTIVTPQISAILEFSGFLSPNFIIYPLGSTALILHQNYYKLLNQECGDLYQQGKQRNCSVERFSCEVILNSSGILCHDFQPWLW